MNLTEVLSNQRKGRCLIEAQEKLQELVKKCSATGKKGSFSLKLTLSAAESTVVITDEVKISAPEPNKLGTTFYADEKGGLHKEDPKQGEFAEVTKMDDAVNQ